MTANQVAYAVTTEQARHNAKSEELAKYASDIEATKAEYQRSYQERDLELKRAYNDAYVEYLKGDLSEKERHQKVMDDLTASKQENDRWYQNISAGLEKQKIAMQKQYNADQIKIQQQNADIYNKKVEYDNSFNSATISHYLVQHELEALKANSQYSLGLINAHNDMYRNQIMLMEARAKNRAYNSKALENISQAIKNTVDAAGAISGKLLLLGGL